MSAYPQFRRDSRQVINIRYSEKHCVSLHYLDEADSDSDPVLIVSHQYHRSYCIYNRISKSDAKKGEMARKAVKDAARFLAGTEEKICTYQEIPVCERCGTLMPKHITSSYDLDGLTCEECRVGKDRRSCEHDFAGIWFRGSRYSEKVCVMLECRQCAFLANYKHNLHKSVPFTVTRRNPT